MMEVSGLGMCNRKFICKLKYIKIKSRNEEMWKICFPENERKGGGMIECRILNSANSALNCIKVIYKSVYIALERLESSVGCQSRYLLCDILAYT
jgi:hypothetical protein